MEIKKAAQRASYAPKGTHPCKCTVCNGWTQKMPDGTRTCAACFFREQKQQQAQRAEDNKNQPIKPTVKIGTL